MLHLNRFPVIHLISEELRLILCSQRSTAFHNGHQASTGWLTARFRIRQRRDKCPPSSSSSSCARFPRNSWPQAHGESAVYYLMSFIKTIKWDHTVHNCLSYPANEVAGSAKNTGEGGGWWFLKKQQLCSNPRRNPKKTQKENRHLLHISTREVHTENRMLRRG